MGTIHLETKLGIVFLLLLMSPSACLRISSLTVGMERHLGEGAGLPILFLLSIPVDIWALGLVARTMFLERLRVEPPDSLGSSLWVRSALFGAVYIPLVWFIEGQVTDIGRSISESILDMELLKHLGVAERISLDLILWGSVSTIVLALLVGIGFSIVGRFLRSLANQGRPAGENYQALVYKWDLMRVPADQVLMLGAFTASGVVLGISVLGIPALNDAASSRMLQASRSEGRVTPRPAEGARQSGKNIQGL